jgi:hypothetical protein
VNITDTSTTAYELSVNWTKPTEANGIIVYYIVDITYNDIKGDKETDTYNVTAAESEIQFQENFNVLYAYWDYAISIEAFNSIGPGLSRSNITEDRTKEAGQFVLKENFS